MASDALPGGTALPPVRELAGTLDVSPGTVAAAYRTLRERGMVETSGRRGTRVRHRPPGTPRWSRQTPAPPGTRDLSQGNPNPELLPALPNWSAQPGAPVFYGAPDVAPVLYGAPDVAPALADVARERLAVLGVPSDDLAVTHGALDAIERLLTIALRPGDRVAVEDPGWANLLDLVPALGFGLVPVEVDDDGPVASSVRNALRAGARALVVTSRGQNPTGAALSARRARELAEVLRERPDVLLIEDDHLGDISGVSLASLWSVGPRWAYVGSVAKAWGPDLRLATVAGDAETMGRLRGRLRLGAGWVSHLLQHAVTTLWTDEAAQRTVASAAGHYSTRRADLVAALGARGVEAHGRTGLNVWVPVPDETAVVTRLLTAGWAVAAGARFRVACPPGIRITIADLRAEEVEPLAAAVHAALTEKGRLTG